jgi:hypothetical protein
MVYLMMVQNRLQVVFIVVWQSPDSSGWVRREALQRNLAGQMCIGQNLCEQRIFKSFTYNLVTIQTLCPSKFVSVFVFAFGLSI